MYRSYAALGTVSPKVWTIHARTAPIAAGRIWWPSGLPGAVPEFRYANLAVRGRLLGAILDEQVPTALDMTPDLVSLVGGANDVLRPRYDLAILIAAMDTALTALRGSGATVLLFTAADVSSALLACCCLVPRLLALNEAARTLAERHGALLVDLWAEGGLSDRRYWGPDRLHLNALGHRRVAAAVLDVLVVPGAGADPEWRTPLPGHAAPEWRQARAEDLRWARRHLAPWVHRRLRGRSSGDTVEPKRPRLEPLR